MKLKECKINAIMVFCYYISSYLLPQEQRCPSDRLQDNILNGVCKQTISMIKLPLNVIQLAQLAEPKVDFVLPCHHTLRQHQLMYNNS